MAKRSLLSRCTSYNVAVLRELSKLLNLNIFIYRNFLHFLKQLFYSCGLLYDAVSNTTCVVLEVRMTDEWWIDKDFEGRDRWMFQALFRHCPHTSEEYHCYNSGSTIYPIFESGNSRMHFSATSNRPVTIYFCSLTTNDARRTREITGRIVMTKAMQTMERLFSPANST